MGIMRKALYLGYGMSAGIIMGVLLFR
jgi:hypothetical protein